MPNRAALIILDGIGISAENEGNALHLAKTPFFNELINKYPKCLLNASGQEVGLPWGEFGNSEVGHTNIGLGRVVLQDLPQISKALESKKITLKPNFKEAIEKAKDGNRSINLIGIASDGAVHGHIDHLDRLVDVIKKLAPDCPIYLHLISDGRDVGEKSINKFFGQIESINKKGAKIASLSGRFFAMDRDKNWDRIQQSLDAITGETSSKSSSFMDAVESAYKKNETDEYITPVSIGDFKVNLKEDVFIFANYRADRAIELTRAFVEEDLQDIKKDGFAKHFYTMTTYDDNIPAKSFFSNIDLNDEKENSLLNPAAELIAKAGLRQFHVAETEKFAHVTYFFSGGVKAEFENQVNKIIQSEKVKSYDLFPQMKANEIASELIGNADNYDFMVANFANGDMVGHSGNLDASIRAVEIVDKELSRVVPELLNKDYKVFITADHGNCDEMIESLTKRINKEHSFNPVPFIYASKETQGNYTDIEELRNTQAVGVLADIMPTVLLEMGLELTPEMMGINLKESLV